MDAFTSQRASGVADAITARECLVGRIADQLKSRGYYLAHIDAQAGQILIDVRWAAQLAGRQVGRRTRTYASAAGKRLPGKVTVIVAPVETWSDGEVLGAANTRIVIEDLLAVHSIVNADSQPA